MFTEPKVVFRCFVDPFRVQVQLLIQRPEAEVTTSKKPTSVAVAPANWNGPQEN